MSDQRNIQSMRALIVICKSCDQYRTCKAAQKVASVTTECPLAKWDNSLPIGEFVARLAKPIARVLDRVIGTTFLNCGGCADRRADLNNLGKRFKNY